VSELLKREAIEFLYHPTLFSLTLECPFVTTVWDLQHRLQPFFPEVSTNGKWDLREGMLARTLRRAAGVITGTAVGREELERFYGVPRDRIEIIPHPTPQAALAPEGRDPERVRAKYDLRADYLLYPAQFWPHKNHIGLIRAFHLLLGRGRHRPQLVLVGSDQGNAGHVQQLVHDLRLMEDVRILGFVPKQDLLDLYAGARALVYVTYFGPENLPPLEAFGLGCPVVASRVAGAEEQLGDAALLVDAGSELDIANAVERALSDDGLRSDLVRRGRERARRFTADHFVRAVLRLLDRLAVLRRCWPAA
jgi:glycosyltransferase involved in cell wall biosynthesis